MIASWIPLFVLLLRDLPGNERQAANPHKAVAGAYGMIVLRLCHFRQRNHGPICEARPGLEVSGPFEYACEVNNPSAESAADGRDDGQDKAP